MTDWTARTTGEDNSVAGNADTLRSRMMRTDRANVTAREGADKTRRRNQAEPDLQAYDVWSWGFGGCGALGNRAFRDELAPYLVSELRGYGGALLVTCGLDHTIAVRHL